MRRSPLYSRAPRDETPEPPQGAVPHREAVPAAPRRSRRWAWPLVALLGIGGLAALSTHHTPPPPAPTLQEIDRAVRASLAKQPLPSADAAAYAKIAPSVVRVVAFESHEEGHGEMAPSDGPAHPIKPPEARGKKGKPAAPIEDDTPSIGTGVVITRLGDGGRAA